MTQKGLIGRIIEDTKMTDCNPNKTPASTVAPGSDKDGEPWDQLQWNCASIVGKLSHAANDTRPDIAHAVSQVARFTACPKVSHTKAIKNCRVVVEFFKKEKLFLLKIFTTTQQLPKAFVQGPVKN